MGLLELNHLKNNPIHPMCSTLGDKVQIDELA